MLLFIAPEFEDEANARLETALTLAAERLEPTAWGRLYLQAVCYLAAHILKLRALSASPASSTGFVGAVTSVRSGDLAISGPGFGAGSDNDEEGLKTTAYGQAFLDLRKLVPITPFIN